MVSPAGPVRLFGVNTPERGQCCAREATDRLREFAGTTVRVEAGPRETDRYGRLLYYFYTEDGTSIDAALVREGLARAWARDGQHREEESAPGVFGRPPGYHVILATGPVVTVRREGVSAASMGRVPPQIYRSIAGLSVNPSHQVHEKR